MKPTVSAIVGKETSESVYEVEAIQEMRFTRFAQKFAICKLNI